MWWRIPTAPRDVVNTVAFVDDDGQVALADAGTQGDRKRVAAVTHGPEIRDGAREAVRGFLRSKARST